LQGDNLDKNMLLVNKVKDMAATKECEPGQLAAALGVSMVAIPGTKRVKYLEQNLKALDVEVTNGDLMQLNELFAEGAVAGNRYPDVPGLTYDPNDK
jgi:aryl-alcohol dehydrogenase-like predicted oxidoreductase